VAAGIWPDANAPGTFRNGPVSNFVQNNSQTQQVDQGDIKVDYQITSNARVFARESYDHRTYTSPSPGDVFIGNGQENSESWDHNAVIGYTHTLSPSASSELRLGFSRFNTFHFGNDYGIDENNILGIKNGNLAAFPESSGIANFNINGLVATGSPGSTNATRLASVYEMNEAITWTRGAHTLKFGIDANRIDTTVTNPEVNPRASSISIAA